MTAQPSNGAKVEALNTLYRKCDELVGALVTIRYIALRTRMHGKFAQPELTLIENMINEALENFRDES